MKANRGSAVPLDEFSDGVIAGPLAFFDVNVWRTADACSRSANARTRFGDFFFFRDLGISDGLLNRRLDPEGKVILGRQWVLRDSGVTVRRRYRKLDDVWMM